MIWLLVAGCSAPSLEAPGLAARFVDPPDAWAVGLAGDALGDGIAAVGDLDGDGTDDLVVASPGADDTLPDIGRLDLIPGGPAGPTAAVASDVAGSTYPFASGLRIVPVGLGQVAVGSPASIAGMVTMFSISAGSVTRGSQIGGGFGTASWGTALTAADADGDGIVDLVGGDPDHEYSFAREGLVQAFDALSHRVWIVRGGAASVELGSAVAALDVDGDTFVDVVGGAPGDSGGALWVFAGSATGLSTTPTVLPGAGRLGEALVAVDVNGDGLDDLIAGAPAEDGPGGLGEGLVHVWFGGTAPTAVPDQTLSAGQEYAELGWDLVAPGDIDADGYDDLLVLSRWWDAGSLTNGAWFLYMGGPRGLEAEPAWSLFEDDLPLGRIRDAVATGGDLDGDGYADLAFGLPDWADPDVAQGALVWVRGGVRDLDDDGAEASVDCDDHDPSRFPGAPEACNGIDDDCDGVVPADEVDDDADGVMVCGGDCDDADPTRSPALFELCNRIDDDCDGVLPLNERDDDGDGFSICEGDCDDLVAGVHPGATEVCGFEDEDCDNLIDDADPDLVGAPTWHLDADLDGFGEAAVLAVSCARPEYAVRDDTDCDDDNPAVNPDADEVCNAGLDDDCDGLLDDADDSLVGGQAAYDDADGDGYGDAATEVVVCDLAPGTVADPTDCDDADPDAFPGAPEVEGDGIDQDCDGVDATAPTEPDPTGTPGDPDPTDDAPADRDKPSEPDTGCGCAHASAPTPGLARLLARRRR